MSLLTPLEEVQQVLSSRLLALAEEEPVVETQILPSVIADYLDQLIRDGTEFPERNQDQFECLHFLSGDHELLMPLERIARLDVLKAKRKYYGTVIPECEGEENLVVSLHKRSEVLYINDVVDIVDVAHEEVLWRDTSESERAPWFVGTHRTLLCRVFDPNLMFLHL